MESFYSAASWAGSFLFITAYFLVSRKKISPDGTTSQIINLLGAFFVGISVFHVKNWGAVAGNIAWSLIAFSLLIKSFPKPLRKRPVKFSLLRLRRRVGAKPQIRE